MVNKELISNEKVTIQIQNGKTRRRRLRVGDPDFVPPDGGWGWLIVFACGFSNLSTFPMFQQFGLVFRGKFEELGITETQTTTVINMNSAFNACVGLLNGPVFRRFTYRQVAMAGSLLVAVSLFLTRFCQNFVTHLIFYAGCYGCGIGITQSSNALALNTYFKEKRRIATGLSWSTTALGPIVWPYIIVALNSVYGMEGTLLLFSGFALHAFVCSLLLQPVEWHTKFKETNPDSAGLNPEFKLAPKKKRSILRLSQYLQNEDDPVNTGYEITDPGMPMMVKSNDGWYSQSKSQLGSRISLASNRSSKTKAHSGQNSIGVSNSNLASSDHKDREHRKRERRMSQTKPTIEEGIEMTDDPKQEETHKLLKPSEENHPPNEEETLREAATKLAAYKNGESQKPPPFEPKKQPEPVVPHVSIWRKISIFFDFELFRDPIYVNLMLGITVANFAELNFSILTPMVLGEFHFGKYQIATFMSLLGATDIVARFFVPILAEKVGWDNRTLFLVGVMSMAFGRIILVHTQTYPMSLLVAVIIGAGKGLRTIFMALVIPSHVPLERLPAASGLQLATSGLLFILLGPVVGWIRETVNNYVITLHILNICTYATAIAWTVEKIISDRRKKTKS